MKKLMGFYLCLMLVLPNTSFIAAAQTAAEFDEANVGAGTIGARYVPENGARVKTRVQKGETPYDYDLFARTFFEYFPLQLGDGDYKLIIFENIIGDRYRAVKSEQIKVSLKDPLEVFKASVQMINWNRDMEVIKKADELCRGLKTDKEKIEVIHRYVIDSVSYDYEKIKKIDRTYVPDIEKTIKDGKGICYDYASVLAAMLRSQNIPTKLIKGYSDYVKEYHAWNEVYLYDEKRWMVVDPTYDSVMKKAGKTYKLEKDKTKYKPNREY
ncbi:MAG: transglutaminase-like domain-containing protein [Clostridia bacterium]|nr:transglutaminase-like domain-containing protein [Clostridia bacterium]